MEVQTTITVGEQASNYCIGGHTDVLSDYKKTGP